VIPAYYNEFSSHQAQWLRNLANAGEITPGDVDERDIRDVLPIELLGYRRCHFFAGVGAWDHALALAGWPVDRPVWSGSCPCQSFSQAGRRKGFADERHLWPALLHLIGQRRPAVVFGEQVASKDGLAWLDLVQADLEGADYACGPLDICAAGFGAPHIRQRLYWVADSHYAGLEGRRQSGRECAVERAAGPGGVAGGLGHAERLGAGRDAGASAEAEGGPSVRAERDDARPPSAVGRMADREGGNAGAEGLQRSGQHGLVAQDAGARDGLGGPGQVNGRWRAADWLLCRDGKWRPVEPGTFPLAHGAPARVGRLRAYGNAIVAEEAAEFIGAYLTIDGGRFAGLNVGNGGLLE
jgi:DNA (cytosine-5)-methyltransferase 1